jgi:uncharacterized protein (TIGR02646 family)
MRAINKPGVFCGHLFNEQQKPAPSNADEAKRRWKNFRKSQTHQKLLADQRDLCAYTEVSISAFAVEHSRTDYASKGSHIEHIAPKSVFHGQTFEEANLVLSVMEDKDLQFFSRTDQFGGHHKKDEYDPSLFISPTTANCRLFFNYLSSGLIEPAQGLTQNEYLQAEYTINLLNLNAAYLKNKRKRWIEELNDEIDKLLDNIDALENLAECELCEISLMKIRHFHSAARQCFGSLGERVITNNCPNCL